MQIHIAKAAPLGNLLKKKKRRRRGKKKNENVVSAFTKKYTQMEITTQPRWSGVALCNDPIDPEHGLAQLGLMFKLCVRVRMCTWLYACTCIRVSTYHPDHFLRACHKLETENLTVVHMQLAQTCTFYALPLLHLRCSVCFVCKTEQKLFSELAGVVHSVSVWLLPKAKEPSCRRRGSSCSPTTISG